MPTGACLVGTVLRWQDRSRGGTGTGAVADDPAMIRLRELGERIGENRA